MLSANYEEPYEAEEDDEDDQNCEDCCEEITSCTCCYEVALRQEFTSYSYTVASVPRRDSNGDERSPEAAAEEAESDGNAGYLDWNDSEDRNEDSIEVDDVTEDW